MTEACDPDADIETLRKAIKMQTGEELKLTRKEMCDAYNNISGGKLPLPPLVMTADRTYLVEFWRSFLLYLNLLRPLILYRY